MVDARGSRRDHGLVRGLTGGCGTPCAAARNAHTGVAQSARHKG